MFISLYTFPAYVALIDLVTVSLGFHFDSIQVGKEMA